ncbi:hypothetical protein T11_13227 [Trichinella zimbabwensis]|uniref:Uncharacterized protein n=1 Tax=Trichinella zimbabwensis TaxID=268475 RepID=A0A0V1HMX5_9BILA|nr:hypothetical protein T11_13227 [Trichinella zimbabwensis]
MGVIIALFSASVRSFSAGSAVQHVSLLAQSDFMFIFIDHVAYSQPVHLTRSYQLGATRCLQHQALECGSFHCTI